jgi:hypothetical protein
VDRSRRPALMSSLAVLGPSVSQSATSAMRKLASALQSRRSSARWQRDVDLSRPAESGQRLWQPDGVSGSTADPAQQHTAGLMAQHLQYRRGGLHLRPGGAKWRIQVHQAPIREHQSADSGDRLRHRVRHRQRVASPRSRPAGVAESAPEVNHPAVVTPLGRTRAAGPPMFLEHL